MAKEVYHQQIGESTLIVERLRKNHYVWRLCGRTRDGNVWETDDYEARSIADAIADAMDYIAEWEYEDPSQAFQAF